MSEQNRGPQMPSQPDGGHFQHSYTPPTTIRPPVPKPPESKPSNPSK